MYVITVLIVVVIGVIWLTVFSTLMTTVIFVFFHFNGIVSWLYDLLRCALAGILLL